ncbi:MAG: hypothetical protein FWH55_05915 [Oscillospiraceae bacterium]|nr:hypothetical protein [Oscillospiraceae bacterium]
MGSIIALIFISLTFAALVVFIIKGGNAMIGLFLAAIIVAVLGGLDIMGIQNTVFSAGMASYGPMIVTIIFGAWFGRIMLVTGIVDQIVKKAVELGGSRKLLSWILLTVVTHIIFMGGFGIGLVMAVGMITIPIMVSLGIPKKLASASLCMAAAAGSYVAVSCHAQFSVVFEGVDYPSYFSVAVIAGIIQLVMVIIFEIIQIGNKKALHAWAVGGAALEDNRSAGGTSAGNAGKKNMFFPAYFTPIVPVILCAGLGWPAIPAFALAIVWGIVFSGSLFPLNNSKDLFLKSLQESFYDIGLLFGLLMAIVTFAAAIDIAAPLISSFLQPIISVNPVLIAIVAGLLAPLAMFRGPLCFWGVGAAVGTIFLQMNVFSDIFCMFLIVVPSISMAMSACFTQTQNAWAAGYAKVEPGDFLKTSFLWQWLTTFVVMVATGVVIIGG